MDCQIKNVVSIELTEKINIDKMITELYNTILFYYNILQQYNINNIIKSYDFKNTVIKLLKNNISIIEINKKIYYINIKILYNK